MRKLFFSLNLLLFSCPTFATINFIEASLQEVASNYTLNLNGTGNNLILFGGTGGLEDGGECASPASDSVTCNSCEDTNFDDCNFRRIRGDQKIAIQFTSTENITGQGFIRTTDGNNVGAITGTFAAGSTVTINTVTWGDLCTNITGVQSNDCSGQGTGTFNIGIQADVNTETTDQIQFTVNIVPPADSSAGCDPTDSGLLQYTAFPGDEKIYFPQSSTAVAEPLTFCNSVSTFTGHNFDAIIAFISEESLADVTLLSERKEINLTGTFPDTSIDEALVDGLSNEKPYFTRLALQDEAGNIFSVIPNVEDPPNCVPGIDSTFSNEDIFACPYSTIPLSVAGLLEDDVNCFIATATYGSPLHQSVKDFRAFRSQILLKNKLGVWFVGKYYKWGSFLSVFIANSSWLKKVSRAFLFPLWIFAIVSLKLGFLPSLVLFLLFMGGGFFILTKKLLFKPRRIA